MSEATLSLPRRLWIYQAERFPLGKTALLVAIFSAAGISASAHLAGRALPDWPAFALAFAVTLFLFFHLRVFDEIKDAEDDAKYRPERAVPRGLVTLRQVITLGLITAIIAAIACGVVAPQALMLLLFVWAWMTLMGFEFFVPNWLKAHPLIYLVSHMAIMPLIDLFVTGIEWTPFGAPPFGLTLFLILSFVNGCILEIGRKLWAPEHERAGVESYSALYGPRTAAAAWMGCVILSFVLLVAVGIATTAPLITAVIGLVALIFTLRVGMAYRQNSGPKEQKAVDSAAGLWVFACYVAAGFAPFMEKAIA